MLDLVNMGKSMSDWKNEPSLWSILDKTAKVFLRELGGGSNLRCILVETGEN